MASATRGQGATATMPSTRESPPAAASDSRGSEADADEGDPRVAVLDDRVDGSADVVGLGRPEGRGGVGTGAMAAQVERDDIVVGAQGRRQPLEVGRVGRPRRGPG